VKPFSMSGMIAALIVVFPAFASAQDPTPDLFRELETKYIFGFTFGSDIGPEGERELELTTKVSLQKRTGSYVALEQEAELEYNPTDSFQIELGAAGVSHAISGVEGFDDFHGANFGGLSSPPFGLGLQGYDLRLGQDQGSGLSAQRPAGSCRASSRY